MKQLIYILFIIYLSNIVNSELHQVQIILRHGDRGPINIYPTDPNKEDKWPNGIGELTDLGIRQHYELGKWIRRRYANLLGNTYDHYKVFARSSNIDRTLMSAESHLFGLFENITNNIIPGLRWRPFPVHTVKKAEDNIILEKDDCKNFQNMLAEKFNKSPYREDIKLFDDLLKQISSNINETVDISNFWQIFDTSYCELCHNLTWNKWLTKFVWSRMNSLHEIIWKGMFEDELGRVAAGLLLKKLSINMHNHVNNIFKKSQENQASLLLYFGHDTDVAPLGRLLIGDYTNNYANKTTWQPPYASAIIIELHKNPFWTVKIFYKPGPPKIPSDDVDIDIPPMKIVGCSNFDCPFETFMEIIKNKTITLEEYNEICKNDVKHDMIQIAFMLFVATVFGLVLILGIYKIIVITSKKMYPRTFYSPLDKEKMIN